MFYFQYLHSHLGYVIITKYSPFASEQRTGVFQILAVIGIAMTMVKFPTARANGSGSIEGFCVFETNSMQFPKC